MKLTGLTITLALASLAHCTALPSLSNVEGSIAGIQDAVGGACYGYRANIVVSVTSTAGGLTSGPKRDYTTALLYLRSVSSTTLLVVLESAVPAIINESALDRDENAPLGETIETIPSRANGGFPIGSSTVGTG
ncbi:hypothetical protein PENCOP_c001G06329 [Penicillium coprophilum]|uniref:Uncharacterized protein n=1 Tax=Penicillium coprophilum TaxID=36646 RepID=A0A1V6V721_9EURO|nr:hypothetical protein PENCOP_c001G06329 [Penicillium coprophilum]